jgi:hypothetical protein
MEGRSINISTHEFHQLVEPGLARFISQRSEELLRSVLCLSEVIETCRNKRSGIGTCGELVSTGHGIGAVDTGNDPS